MAQCNETAAAANGKDEQVLTFSYIDHCIDKFPSAPPSPPPDGPHTNLQVVYKDHHIDIPTTYILPPQPSYFFRLSPEIRMMIYKYLIPPAKKVRASGVYDHKKHPKEWIFSTKNYLEQPLLSQLWREARQFILQYGSFIFKKTSEDGGLWWNPEEDTLAFHLDYSESFMPHALEGLQGLEQVHSIELDHWQARCMTVTIQWLRLEDGGERQICSVVICFRTPPHVEKHFIPKYFSHVRTIRVWFDDSVSSACEMACFYMGQSNLETCMHQIDAYAKAWQKMDHDNVHFWQQYGLYFSPSSDEVTDGQLMYYAKPRSELVGIEPVEGAYTLISFDELAEEGGKWDNF